MSAKVRRRYHWHAGAKAPAWVTFQNVNVRVMLRVTHATYYHYQTAYWRPIAASHHDNPTVCNPHYGRRQLDAACRLPCKVWDISAYGRDLQRDGKNLPAAA